MDFAGWLLIVLIAAFLVAYFCFRVADWHSKESDYWFGIHFRVLAKPSLDEFYRPVLEWTRANKPSLFWQFLGWKSPEHRWAEQLKKETANG